MQVRGPNRYKWNQVRTGAIGYIIVYTEEPVPEDYFDDENWNAKTGRFAPTLKTVAWEPGLRITQGMSVRLPGGGLFEILDVRDDDEGNPGVVTLDLEPIPSDEANGEWSELDECERLPGCCSNEHHPTCPELTEEA